VNRDDLLAVANVIGFGRIADVVVVAAWSWRFPRCDRFQSSGFLLFGWECGDLLEFVFQSPAVVQWHVDEVEYGSSFWIGSLIRINACLQAH
jgi:hypothetical protein